MPLSDVNNSFGYDDISAHSLFQDIPYYALAPVLAECGVRHLEKGEILISPGEKNQYLYLLASGRLQVYLDAIDSQMSFPIMRGECIGEMSIIEGRPTSAYVIADEPSNLVVMSSKVFWDRFILLPGAVKNLLRMLTNRMRQDNNIILKTVEQQLNYKHLQQELAHAGKIQTSILPRGTDLLPNYPQVDVRATIEPAKEVGGDFFDAFALDDEHVCISIGDVSGKGMPAALFMVRAVTLLRLSISKISDFQNSILKINRHLCENNEESMFVTLFVGILNVRTGLLSYINGGHNPPFFSTQGADFDLLKVPPGILLGVLEGFTHTVGELQFHPGDTLLLYTDGVTEAQNEAGEFFNESGAKAILDSLDKTSTTKMVVEAVHQGVLDFSAGMPQGDDITLLALRYLGE